MSKKSITLSYEKVALQLAGLKQFRKLSLLSKDQRSEIREIVNTLEDATRGVSTKIGHLQEEYQELKSHKNCVDDAEKMKKLLRECTEEINKAKESFGLYTPPFSPISLNGLLQKSKDDADDVSSEKIAYWGLYTDLEGVTLDDGGEPKKGGGGQ